MNNTSTANINDTEVIEQSNKLVSLLEALDKDLYHYTEKLCVLHATVTPLDLYYIVSELHFVNFFN